MLMRSYSSVMVVSSAMMRQSRSSCNACSAIALSFPPLQQKSTSSGTRASLMARGVFHADAKLAPERGVAQHVLILFICEIRDAAVETEPVSEIVGTGQVETRISP